MTIRNLLLFFTFIFCTGKLTAQLKTVFNNNVTFTVPVGWFVKDSSDKRILLRKNGDAYSKIELKIYEHKEKDLVKYIALDKKKFFADKHTRTVQPDGNFGGKVYKRIKYYNANKVVIANTEVEHTLLWKPRLPVGKWQWIRIETIATFSTGQEGSILKAAEALLTSMKY